MDVGDYVIDTEDGDPDLAVVVQCLDVPIESVTVGGGNEERTVAEDNPEYEPTEPAVRVAFVESGLNTHYDEWTDVPPDELYDGAQANGVKLYTFPKSRLSTVSEEQAEQMRLDKTVDMDSLRARLNDANWTIESTDDSGLAVGKMGEEYHITPAGEVKGDGEIRDPLENLVAEYTT